MKTLRHWKINFKGPKFKAFIYSLLCLAIIAVAVFLGIFYGINKNDSKPIEENIKPKIQENPKKADPFLIKEKVKMLNENDKVTEIEVDVDKINKTGDKKIIIDEEGNKKIYQKEEKEKEEILIDKNKIVDDSKIINENKDNIKNVTENNENISDSNNNEIFNSNLKPNEKEINELNLEDKYFEDENGFKVRLKRFNIVDSLSEMNDLYDLLNTTELLNKPDIEKYTKTDKDNVIINNVINLEFSEKEFNLKFKEIVKKSLSKFNEFKPYVDLFSYDVKYKLINDNKTILVIINWYYNNYSENDRVRYYDELSIDYKG